MQKSLDKPDQQHHKQGMADPANPQTADRLARGKSLGGAPTTYKPEYAQMLLDYMTQPYTEMVEVEHTNKKGETWSTTEERARDLKFIGDFAWNVCGCSIQQLNAWAKRYPEFDAAYTRARQIQGHHIMVCGFKKLADPAMAKFAALNLTDLRDQSPQALTGAGGTTIIMFGAGADPAQLPEAARRQIESRQVDDDDPDEPDERLTP